MSGAHEWVDRRGRAAAATAVEERTPPDLRTLVRVGGLRRVRRGALFLALVVAVLAAGGGLASSSAPDLFGWLVAALLAVVLVATLVLCAHAGGHAWFVPLPALALAVAWIASVAGGRGGPSWALAALSAVTAGGAMAVGGAALSQRLRTVPGTPPLVGATGVVVTALAPLGIVRVAAETWSARSLSGPLPAGALVHVVRLDGLCLDVWSEAGTVPTETPEAETPEELPARPSIEGEHP